MVAFGGVSIWPGSVSGVMVNLTCSVGCPSVRQLLVGLHGWLAVRLFWDGIDSRGVSLD